MLFETVFRSFQEVARHGSIRRAAEHLHITASAVDRQILKLEREIGVPLFERMPRGVKLTAAGELLLASTRKLDREMDATLAQIGALQGLRRGSATIMGLQFLSDALLPDVLTALRLSHPHISYAVHTGTTEAIAQAVVDGDADVGICHAPPRGLPLTVQLRIPMRLGVVVAQGHALATSDKVKMRDCLAYPLILPPAGMELRTLIEASRPRSVTDFHPAIETNSIGLLKALVSRGAGIGLLTNVDVAAEVLAGTLVYRPLQDAPAIVPSLCLVTRAERVLPLPAELFVRGITPALRELGLQD